VKHVFTTYGIIEVCGPLPESLIFDIKTRKNPRNLIDDPAYLIVRILWLDPLSILLSLFARPRDAIGFRREIPFREANGGPSDGDNQKLTKCGAYILKFTDVFLNILFS